MFFRKTSAVSELAGFHYPSCVHSEDCWYFEEEDMKSGLVVEYRFAVSKGLGRKFPKQKIVRGLTG